MRLKVKLALVYTLTVVGLFFIFSLIVCLLVRIVEVRSLDVKLLRQGEQLEDLLEKSPQGQWDRILKGAPVDVARVVEITSTHKSKWTTNIYLSDEKYRAAYISLEDGKHAIMVASSLENVNATVRKIAILVLMAIIGVGLLSYAVIYRMVDVSLSPIRRIIDTARRISVEDLSLRIPPTGVKDELGMLVDTLNFMLDRLESSVSRIRRFSMHMAHGLKTPLTALKAHLELVLKDDRCKECREDLGHLLDKVDNLVKLTNNLLLLEKIDFISAESLREEVSLDTLVLEVFECYLTLAEAKGIDIKLEDLQPCTVKGNRILLYQAISNIVDNAVKFTPSGGTVRIELTCNPYPLLKVEDTGVGIAEHERERIFEELYRSAHVDDSIPGVGLGLTIAKKLFDAHKADLKVQSDLGKGTRFEIHFKYQQSTESFFKD